MDFEIMSVEKLKRKFKNSLLDKGFSKPTHHEMKPGESWILKLSPQIQLGLVLSGNLLIEYADGQAYYSVGQEIFIPSETYHRIHSGDVGANFLLAKFSSETCKFD